MEKKITVSYDSSKGNLILSDHGITNAGKSDQIHWRPGEGVTSIMVAWAKANSPTPTNMFWSKVPHPNGINFKGIINSNLENGKIWYWDYNIVCNVGSVDTPDYKYVDPRIQVDSRI
jgi:hypothetical protein